MSISLQHKCNYKLFTMFANLPHYCTIIQFRIIFTKYLRGSSHFNPIDSLFFIDSKENIFPSEKWKECLKFKKFKDENKDGD